MSIGSQPRFPLATLPTPVQEAPRLRAVLGGPARCPRILLKRDDLTGLALGGNKARKLEFLVADAIRQGATALITTGAVQSNHARMTAAAARLAGLNCSLVLTGHGDDPPVQGNLLLDRLLGAEVHVVQTGGASLPGGDAVSDAIARVAEELVMRGERPYVIPVGGSNAIGALGYVSGTLELVGQLYTMGEAPSRLYYASGSRGTQAGLVLGAKLYGAPYRVVGIAVSPVDPGRDPHAAEIANEAAARIGATTRVVVEDLVTDDGYVGEGYGIPTPGCLEAVRLLAYHEAVFLDPTYTGKAMAGMIDQIRRGEIDPGETVVFLHTGGVPAIFAQPELLLEAAP
ncbi:MAG TPA: D-cysteine desulfhydrase family protein [Thermomicrobiaceae bacterium]|nr:D-cysteine desulfhydrase family protein [Thermomicrobiaceae bacterium]